MSNLKKRISKIEQSNQTKGLVLIAIADGKTNEETLQQYLEAGNAIPKHILYVTELDWRI